GSTVDLRPGQTQPQAWSTLGVVRPQHDGDLDDPGGRGRLDEVVDADELTDRLRGGREVGVAVVERRDVRGGRAVVGGADGGEAGVGELRGDLGGQSPDPGAVEHGDRRLEDHVLAEARL